MAAHDELLNRITVQPGVLGGKPIVRGMRVSVQNIIEWLAAGETEQEILADRPFLEADDIRACLLYAARSMAGENIHERIVIDRKHEVPH